MSRDKFIKRDMPHRYIVEGIGYPNLGCVLKKCQMQGFDGTKEVIIRRLRKGDDTWAELAEKVNPLRKAVGAANKGWANRKREELRVLMLELDERKKALANDL